MQPLEFSADLARSNSQYTRLADRYDDLTPRLEPIRRDAHQLLRLAVGDVVVDVGCGTGKSLAALSIAVGPSETVFAVEPCVAMMQQAKARARAQRLGNVQFIDSEVEALPQRIDAGQVNAFLLMFTHDVLQSDDALNALAVAARPGARFALAGGKFFRGPLAILNPWVQWRQRHYCTTFADYDAPWRKLSALPGFRREHLAARYGGIAYLAGGVWRLFAARSLALRRLGSGANRALARAALLARRSRCVDRIYAARNAGVRP